MGGTLTTADAAYAAGIIDGEGYIGIRRAGVRRDCATRTYYGRIIVGMLERGAVNHLHDLFGGNLSRDAKGRPDAALTRWEVHSAAAERVARVLMPYLRVKHLQAMLLVEFQQLKAEGRQHRTKIVGYRNFPNAYGTPRTVPNRGYSDEYVARLDALYERARDLNGRRGVVR